MATLVAEPASPVARPVPPLLNGDRLTRAEFECRWDLHPEVKRAELIDGEVYIDMSVSRSHGNGHIVLATWAGTYASKHADVDVVADATVRLLGDNDPQPDVALRRRDGGSSSIGEDDHVEGPPELVIEVSASSASYDLHKKLPLYERSGVGEYVVWQLYEERIDWFRLIDGKYVTIEPDAEGIVESSVFPGLRLDVPKALAGDLAGVLAALAR